jgi:hypothetical protein
MLRKDLDELFTQKVTEYLAKGYRFYTGTMNGSQGEIAKVDLTDGKEVLRILMDTELDWRNGDRVVILVGRNTDKLHGSFYDATIWNNHLEIIEKQEFNKISDTYFVLPEEYPEIREKQFARWEARKAGQKKELGEGAKAIVLPFVKRQPRCKSIKLSDIEKVTKAENSKGGNSYLVTAKGKAYKLH